MNFYLSYGAGVGSEALRLWLIDHNWKHEAVYVDHGGDWPETRDYALAIPELTIIKPDVQGYNDLGQYLYDKSFVPSYMNRWCTDKFKIRPLRKYFQAPCITYIGYTIDEAQRISVNKADPKDIFKQYPLVSQSMTRRNAVRFIKDHGQPVPRRSNCYFCPFQARPQWEELRRKHPDLYEFAKEIERRNMAERASRGKEPLTLSANKKDVATNAMEGQQSFW